MSLLRKYYTILKWGVVITANLFLIYSLLNYKGYADLWRQWNIGFTSGFGWLMLVLVFLPLNWLLETKKWQILISDFEPLPLKKAFRSVMGGNTAAFFTPNRIGEFPGRSFFLQEGNRTKGVLMGFIGSFSQTFVIMLGGIPAAVFFLSKFNTSNFNSIYILGSTSIFVLLLLFFFFLPEICNKLSTLPFSHKTKDILVALSEISKTKLLCVCTVALFRYAVFCMQLYFMLRFFGVSLNIGKGIICIATNYLFVTFTPSFAYSEGTVRASAAVLIIKAFSNNTVGIAAAGISIWLINFVMPMIVGSYFLSKTKL